MIYAHEILQSYIVCVPVLHTPTTLLVCIYEPQCPTFCTAYPVMQLGCPCSGYTCLILFGYFSEALVWHLSWSTIKSKNKRSPPSLLPLLSLAPFAVTHCHQPSPWSLTLWLSFTEFSMAFRLSPYPSHYFLIVMVYLQAIYLTVTSLPWAPKIVVNWCVWAWSATKTCTIL